MQEAEKSLKVAQSLIMSMTPQERQFPDMLVAGASAESRMDRVVRGAGRQDRDLANLIVMFGGMRVKMQKMTEQMGGAAAGLCGLHAAAQRGRSQRTRHGGRAQERVAGDGQEAEGEEGARIQAKKTEVGVEQA